MQAVRRARSSCRRGCDALHPHLTELPGADDELELEISALAAHGDRQLALLRPASEVLHERAGEAARQVLAGLGEGHLWRIVEVAPWSRLPEGRHLLVPFDG